MSTVKHRLAYSLSTRTKWGFRPKMRVYAISSSIPLSASAMSLHYYSFVYSDSSNPIYIYIYSRYGRRICTKTILFSFARQLPRFTWKLYLHSQQNCISWDAVPISFHSVKSSSSIFCRREESSGYTGGVITFRCI